MITSKSLSLQRQLQRWWPTAAILAAALLLFPGLILWLGFDRALRLVVQLGGSLTIVLVALLRSTWIVIALFLVLGLFGQQLFIPGVPLNLRGTEVLTLLLFLWWISEKALRRTRAPRSSLDVPVAAYCAVLVVGVLYGIVAGWEPRVAVREGIKLGVIILYFPLKELLSRHPRLFTRGILLPIQIGVAISASLAIASVLARGDPIVLDPYQPETALNAFEIEGLSRLEALVPATSFAFVALMSMGQLLITRKTLTRVLLAALISSASIGVFLTFTRTRWIGLALGMLILLVSFARRARPQSWISFMAIFILLGIVMWFAPTFFDISTEVIIASRLDTWVTQGLDYRGGVHRLNEAQAYWGSFLAAPVFGQGLGAKVSFYTPGQGVITRTYAHNDYVMFLGKLGLVVVVVFIWLTRTVWRELQVVFRFSRETITQYEVISLVAFLAGILLTAASISGFTNFGTGPLVAASLAYIELRTQESRQK